MKKLVSILVVVAGTALILSGCLRKHIESAPPVKQPAQTVESGSQTGLIEETYPVGSPQATTNKPITKPIEEVYEVEAPKEAGVKPVTLGEETLAEEPLPTAKQLQKEAEAAAAETTTMKTTPTPVAKSVETATDTPSTTTPTTVVTGQYFVQVGAFSDFENANRVLAHLIDEGYKDSVLLKTDTGIFRVQAGAFPDETSAKEALSSLMADYPKGFVLKKP